MIPAMEAMTDEGAERRASDRPCFHGGEIFIFLDSRLSHRLRLRDLSIAGVSGVTDAPLTVGQIVVAQLEEMLMPAAQVAWTRHSCVGLSFVNPVSPARLHRLWERHTAGARWSPAMRAAPKGQGWWSEPAVAAP